VINPQPWYLGIQMYEHLLDHKRQVISTTKHEAFSSSSEATD
jgi:hypothetical protein